MLSKLIFSLQICWITALDNLYGPFCQYSNETGTKNWKENTNGRNMTRLSRAPEFGCHGSRLVNYQNLTTPNCSLVNLRKNHEIGTNTKFKSWMVSNAPPPPPQWLLILTLTEASLLSYNLSTLKPTLGYSISILISELPLRNTIQMTFMNYNSYRHKIVVFEIVCYIDRTRFFLSL